MLTQQRLCPSPTNLVTTSGPELVSSLRHGTQVRPGGLRAEQLLWEALLSSRLRCS